MANVNIATVQVTNTFDEWRVATNDVITDRNILRNANYVKDNANFTIANGEVNISRSTGGVLLRIAGSGGADIGGLTETTDLSVTDTANIFLANVETTLEVSGNTYLYSNAIISKNTTISQNANVQGTFNVVTRLISVGNANLNSNLLVGANTTVNQNLYVTGTTQLSNTVEILRDLYVYQNVFVTDTLSITKNLAVPNLVISNVLFSDILKTTSNTLQLRANAATNDSGYFTVVRPTSAGNHAILKWNEADKVWEVLVGTSLSNVAAARVNTSVANITTAAITTANIATANVSTLELPAGSTATISSASITTANITVANVGQLDITTYGTVIDTSGQWVGDPTGLSGPQGAQGAQGFQGVQGAQGFQGVQGTNGTVGTQGAQGFQGHQGVQGTNGTIGTQGAQGFQGRQGDQGFQGLTGAQGVQGATGPQGFQGRQGAQGFQGVEGPTGTQFLRHVTGGFTSGSVYVSASAPGSPATGDIWLDTTGSGGFTQSHNSLTLSASNISSWSKLPNGLLVQWGIVYDSSQTPTITFPTAFVGMPAVVTSTYRSYSGSRGYNHVYNVSTTGATLVVDIRNDESIYYAYWVAIGYA